MTTIAGLHKTKLCTQHYKGGCQHNHCQFAHSLSELGPPDESDGRLFTRAWKTVNRWYGQELSEDIIETIENYFDEEKTRRMTIPKWAIACMIYYKDYDPTREELDGVAWYLQRDVDKLYYQRKELPPNIHPKVPEAIATKLKNYVHPTKRTNQGFEAAITDEKSGTATTYRKGRRAFWPKREQPKAIETKLENYRERSRTPPSRTSPVPPWHKGAPKTNYGKKRLIDAAKALQQQQHPTMSSETLEDNANDAPKQGWYYGCTDKSAIDSKPRRAKRLWNQDSTTRVYPRVVDAADL